MMAQGSGLRARGYGFLLRWLSRVFVGIVLGYGSAANAGEVRVTVSLDGEAPAPNALQLDSAKEQKALKDCGHSIRHSQRLLVSPSGGVAHAVAWLEIDAAPAQDAREVTVRLDQQACEFVPHVLLVPLGGRLAIDNSDPVVHNIRIFQDGARLLEEWQRPRAETFTWLADEPGRYLVRCGVHTWMHAWVVVTPHRYAVVTNAEGEGIMTDVPEGTYTVRVWHETLGEAHRPIAVGAQLTTVAVQMRSSTNQEEPI
jgi:plastocyanin